MTQFSESINDRHLLKAIFLAGGPGSGKSYIASNIFDVARDNITFLGAKLVNSDILFEIGLSRKNLPTLIDTSKESIYQAQMEVREWAKAASKTLQGYYINSLLPLIIDGTGKNYTKIVDQAEALRRIGYDVSMIFVNTSLDVALQRNRERERSLKDSLVATMWSAVQNNMGKFQQYFGQSNFLIVDNNASLDAYSEEAKRCFKSICSRGKELLLQPLQNPIGQDILSKLRSTKGKYLSDITTDAITEKACAYVKSRQKFM